MNNFGGIVNTFFLTTLLGASAPWPGFPSGIKAVYVKDRALMSTSDGVHSRSLTDSKLNKGLPVWSKDGSMIAFLRDIAPNEALGDLVVISENGRELTSIKIKPNPNNGPKLMRFIDRLTWLAPSKIAVSGSVIPGLEETLVVDLSTREVENDEQSDDPGMMFSPDGQHFAYEVGSPHFSPESSWAPSLVIDDKVVYPPTGRKVRFVGVPRWSENSQMLAAISKDEGSGQYCIAVWQASGPLRLIPITGPDETPSEFFWKSNLLIVSFGGKQMQWDESALGLNFIPSPRIVDPVKAAKGLLKALDGVVLRPGVTDPDYWCASCVLTSLQRSSPIDRAD